MTIGQVFWNREEDRVRAGWRALAQLAAWFALLYVGQLVLSSAFSALIGDQRSVSVATKEIAGSLVQLMSQVSVVIAVWLAGRYLDKRGLRSLGFCFDRKWWGDLAFGLALGAMLMAVIFVVEWAAGWVRVTGYLVTREGGLPFWPGILVPLIGYLAVGIAEEMWSRGYILTNLAEGFSGRRMGPAAAIALATLIQGVVFALLHANNPNASVVSTFNIFLVAFLLALGYVLTGALAISIGLHITWNFFQGNVFGFPVSGSGFSVGTFIGTEQVGPALWTGGTFGPEAGLVGIGALLLGGALILLWVRLHHGSLKLAREIAEAPERPVSRDRARLEPRAEMGPAQSVDR